ncbi:MAG: hypothetical protein ACT6R2_18835, partial [Blastomonas fulva]|uniref:hypothetical protein n=1 Tax=Blastomonas fulva TaxID=1550728 RepID=UPI0040334E57
MPNTGEAEIQHRNAVRNCLPFQRRSCPTVLASDRWCTKKGTGGVPVPLFETVSAVKAGRLADQSSRCLRAAPRMSPSDAPETDEPY